MKANYTSVSDLNLSSLTPGLYYVHTIKAVTIPSINYSTVVATVILRGEDKDWNFDNHCYIDLFPLFNRDAIRPISFRSKDLKGMFIEIFDTANIEGATPKQVLWTAYYLNEIIEMEHKEELDQLLYDNLIEDQSLDEIIAAPGEDDAEGLIFDEEN